MRYIKRITVAVFIIMFIAFIGGKIYASKTDKVPPVISAESDEIHVQAGCEEQELLQGLTAEDNSDGDLTDQIMVGKISRFTEKAVSKVEYVVLDESNNVGTYERTVYFDNYSSPRFALSQPLMYKVYGDISISDRLTAQDVLSGDISDKIKFSSASLTRSEAGVYDIMVSVKNEYGDEVQETLPVNVVNESEYGTRIELNTYLVYLTPGSTIDPLSYVSRAVNTDGTEADRSQINVIQQVDTTTPGTGQFRYELNDGNGDTDVTFLTVIVTE